jgi:signal transduction histidine kinase
VKVELMVQPPEPEPGKFMEVTARPLKDVRGNLRGGVAVLHDISERKRSEADLAQQAKGFGHFLDRCFEDELRPLLTIDELALVRRR